MLNTVSHMNTVLYVNRDELNPCVPAHRDEYDFVRGIFCGKQSTILQTHGGPRRLYLCVCVCVLYTRPSVLHSRQITCLGVVYSVPEARELMDMTAADLRSQIALVEQDLTAYRSAKNAGQA